MNYYNEDYLMHYGVKGQKWGVRRYQNSDGTLKPAGKKRYSEKGTAVKAKLSSAGKKAGKVVGKQLQKRAEKIEKERKSYEKTTDWFGVGGSAIRSYYDYQGKKAAKGFLAEIINNSANAYISRNSSKYYISRGVDFARRAAIGGLSFSAHMDKINAFANVGHSYMYAASKQ